ncbi:MarR family transcriptional regulator [Kitasatospora sp. NBC_01287]|uniref:MarR family winged helix-turn-helix transcriptional regulator n=1 Tax=Kitasatospora sp. NBC_01287 TaxID=2903573 RepID=UPI0022539AD8|nr:MarR family transcriptional regulator [Kitasatospora sp. NBC_01287]MCX4746426.1 MarR family transcriptional regulator [Kitasatospora sp. NBC_01287]
MTSSPTGSVTTGTSAADVSASGSSAPDDGSQDSPSADNPSPDGAAELADELTRAMKRIRHRTMDRLEPYGLTPGQGRALRVLAHAARCETPGRAMRLSELADRLNVAPRSATTVVDALEQAALVERVPDPVDRRSVGLVLTAAGRAAVERVARVRQEVAEDYFRDADPADVVVMLRVLRAAEAAQRPPAPA